MKWVTRIKKMAKFFFQFISLCWFPLPLPGIVVDFILPGIPRESSKNREESLGNPWSIWEHVLRIFKESLQHRQESRNLRSIPKHPEASWKIHENPSGIFRNPQSFSWLQESPRIHQESGRIFKRFRECGRIPGESGRIFRNPPCPLTPTTKNPPRISRASPRIPLLNYNSKRISKRISQEFDMQMSRNRGP